MTTMTRSDAAVKKDVLEELRWDSGVDPSNVAVSIEDGVVTLSGTVLTYAEHLAAEEAAFRVAGVLNVANSIRVEPPGSQLVGAGVRGLVNDILVGRPSIAPATIRDEIVRALERRAARAAHRMEILVHDGEVTLSGGVDSRCEREAVIGAARGTRGVRSIHDRLTADPSV